MAKVHKAQLTIGVDFGTYASGIAFQILPGGALAAKAGSNQAVRTITNWPGERFPYPKNRTALLYKDGSVVNWGWEAVEMSTQLPAEQLAPKGPYVYVEGFKLCLEPASLGAKRKPLPAGLLVVPVVADFLRCMRKYAMERVGGLLGMHVDPASIRWCVTVPALWSETAKDLMRSAATRAGMADTHDQLLMTLEPEAAALAAVHMPNTMGSGALNNSAVLQQLAAMAPGTSSSPAAGSSSGAGQAGTCCTISTACGTTNPVCASPLQPGDTVLVVDVGGGTSDLTVHKVVHTEGVTLRLEEAAAGSGDFHAGASVDAAFDAFCRERVLGWEDGDAGTWQYVMERWQDVKRNFSGLNSLNLPLPQGLRLKPNEHAATPSSAPSLNLSAAQVTQLYEPTLEGIISQARALLSITPCNKVLLVGGFCASRYVQSRLRAALQRAGVREVVLPPAPEAAVVMGSVLYGTQPGAITARCMRACYGIAHSPSLTPELKSQLGCSWATNAFYVPVTRQQHVDDMFRKFVERGQKVYSEQVVTHTFVPVYPIQDSIPFLLYRTHDNNAVRVTDEGIVRVASVSLPLPADWSRSKSWRSKQEYDVAVSLFFGGTELKLQATDKQTGKSVNTSVAYQ